MLKKLCVVFALVCSAVIAQAEPINVTLCIDRAYEGHPASLSAVNKNGQFFSLTQQLVNPGECRYFMVDNDVFNDQYHLQLTFADVSMPARDKEGSTFCSIHMYDFSQLKDWLIVVDADHSGFDKGICE